jgi:hypothetical protein
MRAKFQVTNVVKHNETSQDVSFRAVTSKPFDADGKSDDNDFARWSPSGELKIGISNPALIDKLVVGEKYYLDFTLATE